MSSDEQVDRLLRHAAQPPAGRATAACLDGETLAAFMDGGLRPDERAAAEAHIADCGHCLHLTAAMAQSEPSRIPEPRRAWFRAGWLVPLTAAAVGVSAWLIIRDPRAIETPVLQDAISRGAPAPAPAAPPFLPSERSEEAVPELRQDQPARTDALSRRGAADSTGTRNRLESKENTEADAVSEAGKPASPAPIAPAAAAPSTEQLADLARDGMVATRRPATAMQVVSSPDPGVRWRFSGTAVEKTTDGGATWILHTPGATGFVAGAAPSVDVFWLAGRAGLVLLTTDGRTWQRVDLPDTSSDVVTITAAHARSATATIAAGRVYRTSDAGRTWVLQESSAAPF